MRLVNGLLGSMIALLTLTSHADSLQLQDLSQGDFNRVIDNLSAAFNHTAVEGAAPLGHLWGFEIGVIGMSTNTPDINRLVHEADSNASLKSVPGAELLGEISLPFGLSGEIGGIPKIGASGIHISSYSLAAKWSVSEIFPLPVDLAVKLHTTQAHLDAKETVNDVQANYTYNGSITGLTFLASKSFVLVEPYVGIGFLNAKGTMSADGVALFDPNYTASSSASSTRGSSELLIGADLNLFVVKLGFEYARAFDVDRYAGKLAFYF